MKTIQEASIADLTKVFTAYGFKSGSDEMLLRNGIVIASLYVKNRTAIQFSIKPRGNPNEVYWCRIKNTFTLDDLNQWLNKHISVITGLNDMYLQFPFK